MLVRTLKPKHQLDQIVLAQPLQIIAIHPNLESATRPTRKGWVITLGDEARVGQKNKITWRWAKRGTRPSAPHDQRTASAYIFGAICSQEGKGATLVLPSCNTEAMAPHLEEFAAAVAPGAHAILVLDQAGWHVSKALPVPPNITLVSLPSKSRTQSGREYLAVHEGQLAVEPSVYLLHEHRRPLLLCLEQTRRPAMAHYVHRNSPMGETVMLIRTWYYLSAHNALNAAAARRVPQAAQGCFAPYRPGWAKWSRRISVSKVRLAALRGLSGRPRQAPVTIQLPALNNLG